MGNDRSKRVTMGLLAELVEGPQKNHRGILVNLSDEGVSVIVESSPTDGALNFSPGAEVELNFQYRPERIINLHTEIRWVQVFRNPPHGLTNIIGMKIKDPPSEYKEFLKTLQYYHKIYSPYLQTCD